jgi:hypothetical protein
LDLGLGTPVNYGRTEHQALHKVWGTQLDGSGHRLLAVLLHFPWLCAMIDADRSGG